MDDTTPGSLLQYEPLLNTGAPSSLAAATLNSSIVPGGLSEATSTHSMTNRDVLPSERFGMDRGGANNANLEMLLRLEAIRNSELQAQVRFNQDDSYNGSYNNEGLNNFGTNFLQQYAQQQHRQQQQQQQHHSLEQSLLANQLQQLQQQQRQQQLLGLDTVGLQQPYPGMMSSYMNAPTTAVGLNFNDYLGYTQNRSYLPQGNNQQEQLLAALLSNINDNSSLPQQTNHAIRNSSSAHFFAPTNAPENALLDQNLQFFPSQLPSSSSGIDMSHLTAGVPPGGITLNTSNQGAAAANKKDVEEQTPIRALSAYNFFFRYERERILNSNPDDNDSNPDLSSEKQESLLKSHWNRDRTIKRRHRKSHGKISFAELSKRISQRWKELPEDQKNFFAEIAAKDWERYHREVEQQKRSGQPSLASKKHGV
jgi:HMG (high mobility group) box